MFLLTNGLLHNIIAMLLKQITLLFRVTGEIQSRQRISRCGSAWLERYVRDVEAAGSNPVTSIFLSKGMNSLIIHSLPQYDMDMAIYTVEEI